MAAILDFGLDPMVRIFFDSRLGNYDQKNMIIDISHGIFPTIIFFLSAKRVSLAATLDLDLTPISRMIFDGRFRLREKIRNF